MYLYYSFFWISMSKVGYEQVQTTERYFEKKEVLEDNLVEIFFLDYFTALEKVYPLSEPPPSLRWFLR